MIQRSRLFLLSCLISLAATAQQTTMQPVTNPQKPVSGPPTFNYKKLNPKLEYAFIVNKPTKPNPEEGDQIFLNLQSVCNNRLMYNTAQAFKGKPATFGVAKPSFKGDLIEAIMLMTPGDSIVCLVDADALFGNSKSKKPDFIKSGDKVQYFIKLVSIKPKELVQKEQQALFMKQMKEQEVKQKAAAAKQMIVDDKALKAYFIKNKISPIKTASGLYYSISKEGPGEMALNGDSITMNYTGMLLDGTKFDSNEDTAFRHVQPFNFVLGRGAVIKGWDEGVALLKSGSKATFYIPSPLAYGQQARPGGGANPKGIPANSILLFDVELVSSKHPTPPPPVEIKAANVDSIKGSVAPKEKEIKD